MADLELFWMFKSFMELPLEPNCGKVRLVIFLSCLCFPKCPYPTELSLIFPWLVLSDSGLFSLIKFTANPQSFAVSVDTKVKVIWAWKEVLKEEALNSFICHYSLTHSLTHSWTCSILEYLWRHILIPSTVLVWLWQLDHIQDECISVKRSLFQRRKYSIQCVNSGEALKNQ